jgi:hypothetical protein
VARDGLEAALEKLREAGVWVSHEEFKGRKPLVRGGRHIRISPQDFVNPLIRDVCRQSLSSGSSGRRVAAPETLPYLMHREICRRIDLEELGAAERRWLQLASIMPSPHALTHYALSGKTGPCPDRWYARADGRMGQGYSWATRALLAELRWLGAPVPPLVRLPHNDFLPVAREIAQTRTRGVLALVDAPPSAGVRVASAALDAGLDISGTRFLCNAETLSEAKAAVFHRAGTEAYATYMATEAGAVGMSCRHYEGQNTVHHFRDATAIVAYRQPAPWSAQHPDGPQVNSLLFTTLLPTAPFFLINLELGDHGVPQPAKCGCRFHRLGFDTVISDIYSYTKLTLHGSRLFGSDIARIIEHALPQRFGGSPSDYQLVEQEAGSSGTRIVLRVNPRILARAAVPPEAIRECFLQEVRKLFGGQLWASTLTHAGAVEVVAQPPLAGWTGKVLPFYLLARGPETSQDTPRKETVDAP